MELCVQQEATGHLRICKLLAFGTGGPDTSRYIPVPYLTIEQVIQFLQHMDPRRFHAVRSQNTRAPLHWNIGVECSARKKGLTTVFKLQPNRDFETWQVFALPSVFPQEIRTERKVIGFPLGSIETFVLSAVERISIQYDGGLPYRLTQWTEATRDVMSYVLHYHSAKLSLATQALLEPVLPERSLQRRLLRLDQGGDFILYIRSLRGKKRCIFTRDTGDGGYVIPGLGRLQLFCWVAPWLPAAQKKCSHLQVDASFHGSAPYAYYVPQAVIANRGLACGLVIAPTERAEMFATFDEVSQMDFARPILSDMGRAIDAYARTKPDQPHYWCHRHLLEAIGSSSYAAHIFLPLLRATSEAQFMGLLPQFCADVAAFVNAGIISSETVKKFQEYLGGEFPRDEHGKLNGDVLDVNLDIVKKWVFYARGGVANCSNQAEAFHKAVNASVTSLAAFMTKLRNLITKIEKNRDSLNGRIIDGVREAQSKLSREREEYQSQGVTLPSRETCDCAYNERNRNLYQTDGFCIHTVGAGKLVSHDAEKLLKPTDPEIPTEEPEILYAEDIWPLPKRHEETHEPEPYTEFDFQVLSDSRVGYFAHSLALLLHIHPADVTDLFYRYTSAHCVPPDVFDRMDPMELAELKLGMCVFYDPSLQVQLTNARTRPNKCEAATEATRA